MQAPSLASLLGKESLFPGNSSKSLRTEPHPSVLGNMTTTLSEVRECRTLIGHPWPVATLMVRGEVNSNLATWTGRQKGDHLKKNGGAAPKSREM